MATKRLSILCGLLLLAFLLFARQKVRLVILHTNDTHSQIDPTAPTASRNPDMGGYARRLGVINQIRSQEEHVLLFDAGDFSQGTPYYNFFNGRVEIKGYNLKQYDAVVLGNHEFDNGMDSLAMMLRMATFPVVVSNYGVKNTKIAPFVKPWKVIKKGGLRIGIMGMGIEPKGLLMEHLYEGLVYKDPIKTAQKVSAFLKYKKNCDLIICLSHLGSDSTSLKVNDFDIARNTQYIDLIIGGHSHQMLVNVSTPNAEGRKVMIAQSGRSGLFLGRIDITLETEE